MPRFHGPERVVDHPRPAMDAIIAALRPEHVEVHIYRQFSLGCGHCGVSGTFHDEGYLAGFLAKHADCKDLYDADGKRLLRSEGT